MLLPVLCYLWIRLVEAA